MSARHRRPFRILMERDVAEIERRLALYRANSPKRIAQELGVHVNTVTTINLGRHVVQARIRGECKGPPAGRATAADVVQGQP